MSLAMQTICPSKPEPDTLWRRLPFAPSLLDWYHSSPSSGMQLAQQRGPPHLCLLLASRNLTLQIWPGSLRDWHQARPRLGVHYEATCGW